MEVEQVEKCRIVLVDGDEFSASARGVSSCVDGRMCTSIIEG